MMIIMDHGQIYNETEDEVRKDLKNASEHIEKAKVVLEKVANSSKVPEEIRIKSQKIVNALDIDIKELTRMREYR